MKRKNYEIHYKLDNGYTYENFMIANCPKKFTEYVSLFCERIDEIVEEKIDKKAMNINIEIGAHNNGCWIKMIDSYNSITLQNVVELFVGNDETHCTSCSYEKSTMIDEVRTRYSSSEKDSVIKVGTVLNKWFY